MSVNKMTKGVSENGNAKYAHLPRARDYKLPKKLTPELKELMKATRDAMVALHREEEKYGKRPRL